MRNMSVAVPAKSFLAFLLLSVGLTAALAASASDPVYKWKDSSGQSHYSQQPPEGIKYQMVTTAGTTTTPTPVGVGDTAPVNKTGAPPVTASPQALAERTKNCDVAKKNVDLLTSRTNVTMDLHGDGKPVPLSPQQQAAELAISKQQVSMLCSN